MHHIKNWSVPTELSPPAPGQLHLWRIELAAGSKDFHDLLSTDEHERAQRHLSDQDRHRFIRTRGAVRTILGRYLGVPPQDLKFVYGLHGKPFLCFPASVLAFNLSHAGNLALLAVSRETAIGIDLEQPQERPNILAIASRVFGSPIREELAEYKGDQLTQAFFHYWTALEARTKALGNGIFSNRCGTRDAALEIQRFSPTEGHVAAIAMEQAPPFDEWETYQFNDQ